MTRIKELRKSSGLTQDELARKIGCSRINISRYESGARRPKPEIANRIGAILGLSKDELWEMFYEQSVDEQKSAG